MRNRAGFHSIVPYLSLEQRTTHTHTCTQTDAYIHPFIHLFVALIEKDRQKRKTYIKTQKDEKEDRQLMFQINVSSYTLEYAPTCADVTNGFVDVSWGMHVS